MYGSREAAQFGVRAFDTDYPNRVDRRLRRTGDGIWLHGTDQPERTALQNSSRGCVVIRNKDVDYLTPLIELRTTPIVILDRIDYISNVDRERKFSEVEAFLAQWRTDWEEKDYSAYRERYAPDFSVRNMSLPEWIKYKENALENYQWISVDISDIRIFAAESYYYVDFRQRFSSDLYEDDGVKRLYLKEEDGRLLILSEQWDALDAAASGTTAARDDIH